MLIYINNVSKVFLVLFQLLWYQIVYQEESQNFTGFGINY